MNSSKPIDISKSSLVGLKAELLRKQEEVKRLKELKQDNVKPEIIPKKKSVLEKSNDGVEKRSEKDVSVAEEDFDALQKSREVLEAKSRLYDKLKGKIVDEETKSRYLIDFDLKRELERQAPQTVIINRALEDDVANYTCKLVNSKNNNSEVAKADFHVVGKPYVKLPEFITVIEEEKLKLECTVIGSHSPYVEWHIGNETYDTSNGRVKLSPDPVRGVKNALLELEPARMSDRGYINCTAHNTATTFEEPNVASTYVRIKDKYAALWPFLGICAEVIVLCTVIFVYEKKRNKAELEESDTDQSPEQKNTPDHGKDSVRQRK